MTEITTTTVQDQITAISATDKFARLDQLTTAFGIDAETDTERFDALLAALRTLTDAEAIVEGAVAAAITVYAPAGATVPQEW